MQIDDVTVRPLGEASADTQWDWRVVRLLSYWQEARGHKDWPKRADIDPLNLRRILPVCWMVDAIGVPPRFRYRLIGTEVARSLGTDPTGKWLDEAFPLFRPSGLEAEAVEILETGLPTVYDGPPVMASDPRMYAVQRVAVPLSSTGNCADILMGLSVFRYR